jgi:hypothetical protein
MAKRYTDTNKYKKEFIRSLQGPYKLLWDYLYHECDHAGIWIVDFQIAQIYLGSDMPVSKDDALTYFNEGETRVIEFSKNRWFIPSFIEFQYGELRPENRVHLSVIKVLNQYDLIQYLEKKKDHPRPLVGSMDIYMDKDKDKDKDMDMPEKKQKPDKPEKQDKPTPFEKSPHYPTEAWCAATPPDWTPYEKDHWWHQAEASSNKGNRYTDWIKAVKNWKRENDKAPRHTTIRAHPSSKTVERIALEEMARQTTV